MFNLKPFLTVLRSYESSIEHLFLLMTCGAGWIPDQRGGGITMMMSEVSLSVLQTHQSWKLMAHECNR